MERPSGQIASSSSAAPVGAVSWRARGCVLAAAIVCAGVAGPGSASAADTFGIDSLVGDIQAEVSTELAAVVPQPAAAGVQRGVSGAADAAQAAADEIPTAAEPVAPSTLEVMDAASSAQTRAPGSPPDAVYLTVFPAGAEATEHVTWTSDRVHVVPRFFRSSSRRSVVRSRGSLAVSATARSESTVSGGGEVSVHQRVQAMARAGNASRSGGAAPPPRHSGLPPNREPLPPGPGPERPDMSSAGQGGGQGLLLPLVLGALAALLALFGFALLPRVLPLPAFRKPRRIVLPPWRPG